VSELCAYGRDARAAVNQRRRDTMPKCVKPRELNPERCEQRA
jgi:hypothetical protein